MGKTWAERLTPSWLTAARATLRAATRGAQRDMFMSEPKQHLEDIARKSHWEDARTKLPACVGSCAVWGSSRDTPWLNSVHICPCSWGSPFLTLAHIMDRSSLSPCKVLVAPSVSLLETKPQNLLLGSHTGAVAHLWVPDTCPADACLLPTFAWPPCQFGFDISLPQSAKLFPR